MKKDLFCLLIDDDADDHAIFQMSINRLDAGIRVDHAMSGIEAVEMLKSYKVGKLPDFIFLDLNMHIMTGIECLTELKTIPDISEIPVIIFSTTLNEKIIYTTLQLGAFDHIEKPNKAEDLDNYLNRIFQVVSD
jgi:CheY-like chemotaxis protein